QVLRFQLPLFHQDLSQRFGLLQHPGVHGRDEAVAADEIHLQGQDTEEEIPIGSYWGVSRDVFGKIYGGPENRLRLVHGAFLPTSIKPGKEAPRIIRPTVSEGKRNLKLTLGQEKVVPELKVSLRPRGGVRV